MTVIIKTDCCVKLHGVTFSLKMILDFSTDKLDVLQFDKNIQIDDRHAVIIEAFSLVILHKTPRSVLLSQ